MEIAKNTPQISFGVADVTLKCFQPFVAGHVCTEKEAGVLNQTIVENVRNNKRKQMEEMVKAKASPVEMQKVVDDYLKNYDFGVRQGGFRTSDPIQAEAMRDARERVIAAYKKKGVKVGDISGKDVSEKALKLIEKNPKLLDRAKRIVAEREKELDGVVVDV